MSGLRATARRLAAASGALAVRHRIRNRETLTIVMLHRVTAPGTAAARMADPAYTLDAPLFEACLRFFRQHYTLIDLDTLRAARRAGPPLPPRALLLTFDDGWRDNLDIAAPLLAAVGAPAIVFVASDVLTEATPWWWQEILLRALRNGRHDFAALWHLAGHDPPPAAEDTPETLRLLLRYGALDPAHRDSLLAPLAEGAAQEGAHMVDGPALAALADRIAIGAHGAAHLPLSLMRSPGPDMARARSALQAALPGTPIDALSFPHGRYDATVLRAADAAGYDMLFTSDACLNAAPGGRPGRVLGRINVEAAAITDGDGRLDPARLATWMFNRPITALARP